MGGQFLKGRLFMSHIASSGNGGRGGVVIWVPPNFYTLTINDNDVHVSTVMEY